jgi:DNA-binding NarL/FixJ family response regulator
MNEDQYHLSRKNNQSGSTDDQPSYGQAFGSFSARRRHRVVAEADDGEMAIGDPGQVDVAVLDIRAPSSGIEVARWTRTSQPPVVCWY